MVVAFGIAASTKASRTGFSRILGKSAIGRRTFRVASSPSPTLSKAKPASIIIAIATAKKMEKM